MNIYRTEYFAKLFKHNQVARNISKCFVTLAFAHGSVMFSAANMYKNVGQWSVLNVLESFVRVRTSFD